MNHGFFLVLDGALFSVVCKAWAKNLDFNKDAGIIQFSMIIH